jgi:hypothetical protein
MGKEIVRNGGEAYKIDLFIPDCQVSESKEIQKVKRETKKCSI